MHDTIPSYLNSFINYEHSLNELSLYEFKLERFERLLELLGNPQDQMKVIHVAGTKGKGSTCIFIAHILKEAVFRVGLYTSPHIYHYRERIRILDKKRQKQGTDLFPDMISNFEIEKIIEEIKPAVEKVRFDRKLGYLTLFELTTGIAFYYFRQERVDFVVLETGLGGRLDATNTTDARICGITSIGLDHTHILGDTLEKIALEKAAIIKTGREKVVVAAQKPEVKEVIDRRCESLSIRPLFLDECARVESRARDPFKQRFNLHFCMKPEGGIIHYPSLLIPLAGEHQLINATMAVVMGEYLKEMKAAIPREAVYRGLEKTFWPLRFEIIQNEPITVLDGAHTEDSCQGVVKSIQDFFPERKVTLVFGLSNDKDKQTILRELNKIATTVIATKADHPRAARLEEEDVRTMFPGKKGYITSGVKEALHLAREITLPDDLILVTGSFFVASEARYLLRNNGDADYADKRRFKK